MSKFKKRLLGNQGMARWLVTAKDPSGNGRLFLLVPGLSSPSPSPSDLRLPTPSSTPPSRGNDEEDLIVVDEEESPRKRRKKPFTSPPKVLLLPPPPPQRASESPPPPPPSTTTFSLPRHAAAALEERCAWCHSPEAEGSEFSLKTSEEEEEAQKSFCSERCFTLFRRAAFKKSRVCDWCRKALGPAAAGGGKTTAAASSSSSSEAAPVTLKDKDMVRHFCK